MKKTKYIDGGIMLSFDSMSDLLDNVKEMPSGNHSQKESASRTEFTGGTWKQAVDQAELGNAPQTIEFESALSNIRTKASDLCKSNEIKFDVTGQSFDVGRVLTGEPECWINRDMYEPKEVVKIFVNTSFSFSVSKHIIRNRGAAITALIDLLSEQYIVEPVFIRTVEYNGRKDTTVLTIPNSPLDIDSVCFIASNPMYLRRLMFASLELGHKQSKCGSYGLPADFTEYESSEDTIYFGSNRHESFHESDFESIDSAARYVARIVEERSKRNGDV